MHSGTLQPKELDELRKLLRQLAAAGSHIARNRALDLLWLLSDQEEENQGSEAARSDKLIH